LQELCKGYKSGTEPMASYVIDGEKARIARWLRFQHAERMDQAASGAFSHFVVEADILV
jgi:hypothetical protein